MSTTEDHHTRRHDRLRRIGFGFTALVCIAYFGFLATAAWAPNRMAAPLFGHGMFTLAMVWVLVLIGLSVALTAAYTLLARAKWLLLGTSLPWLADFRPAHAQEAATQVVVGNPLTIGFFALVVAATVAITVWAAKRTRTGEHFYTAGGTLTPFQNGLAIAGDYLSASALLGITALIYFAGFDGVVYTTGFVVSWPIVYFLMAERLRDIGRFTFSDVLAARLARRPSRILAASSTLVIVSFYLVAQMVGAGQVIDLLFGVPYAVAVVLVGVLMVLYVAAGGMLATTWVQIVKALLLLGGVAVLTVLALGRSGFDPSSVLAEAVARHPKGAAILVPQSIGRDPISGLSLGLALMFGTAGLPHILMRFFTVANGEAARRSVFWATLFVALFSLMAITLGYAAIGAITGNTAYIARGVPIGGANMIVLYLAHLLGGDALLGLVAALAMATILAVVAGLTMSAASAIAYDLYVNVVRHDVEVPETRRLAVSRIATVFVGALAVVLGIVFARQNIAYMVGLAFGIAASANFPVLLLAMYWRGLTTRGAIAGGAVGLVGSVVLTAIGPAVWVKVLGHAAPIFPWDPPTLVTLPLAFLVAVVVSRLDASTRSAEDRATFDAVTSRSAPTTA